LKETAHKWLSTLKPEGGETRTEYVISIHILSSSHWLAGIMFHHSMHFYDKQCHYVIQEHLVVVCQCDQGRNNIEEDNNGTNKTDLNVCELHTTPGDASYCHFA
jgi:hypothetical protein